LQTGRFLMRSTRKLPAANRKRVVSFNSRAW
jgi:hypothetical protein